MRLIEELASDAVFDHTQTKRDNISFWDMFINYYSHTEYIRTPEQIYKDQYIIFGMVRCRAWMIIPLAVLCQFCLGSLYAWSMFNKPIDNYLYGNPEANRAPITFYISLGMLGLSGAAFGPWIESHSPCMCAILAAVFFFAGHLTAALGLACNEIGLLYFGYGFISGIGLGIGYVSTIDAVIQWYPNARGFTSGLAVSGFGSGAVAFSNFNAFLVHNFTIPQAFAILGSAIFVVMILCALVMRPPPPSRNLPGVAVDMLDKSLTDLQCSLQNKQNTANWQQQRLMQHNIKGKSATIAGQTITVGSNSGDPVLIITLSQALSSRDFWLLWVAFFVNLVFGVVIISSLASLLTNVFGHDTPATVATVVTIEGLFNACGRLFMGWASDWFGRRRTFLFVITLQIVIVACLIVVLPHKPFWAFVVLIWLATFCYGGGVGVIAATLADMFGASNMSGCHGVILTGWSMASIGGGLTYTGIVNMLTRDKGYTLSDPFVYIINQYWILSLLGVGWFILLMVRITPRERLFPRVHGQVFCHTLAGFMIRLAKGTSQNGLHDYEFLSASAPGGGGGATAGVQSIDDDTSSVELAIEKPTVNSCDSRPPSRINNTLPDALSPEQADSNQLCTNDTASISTYMHDETMLIPPKGGKKPASPTKTEAFNYIAHGDGAATMAGGGGGGAATLAAGEGDREEEEEEEEGQGNGCVQLMCATPPTRHCLRLFGRWRIEIVSQEEVTTIWRMYLACALLASSEKTE